MASFIYKIAGTGTDGYSGDGGPATSASLNDPALLSYDPAGGVIVPDSNSHRIRRVDLYTGIITTIAGNGVLGSSGNGGLATSASLNYPNQAVYYGANLYIADDRNHCIRKVDSTGSISTFAGLCGTWGLIEGSALTARFYNPIGLAIFNQSYLLVADYINHRIRKIDFNTGTVSTFAGTSVGFSGDGGLATNAKFNIPHAVAVDSLGNVYVADRLNSRVRVINASGYIQTYAGNGNGYTGSGSLSTTGVGVPWGLAFDQYDNLYFSSDSQYILKVTKSTQMVSSLVGNGSALSSGDGGVIASTASVRSPWGVLILPSGNLVFTEREGSSRVHQVYGVVVPPPPPSP